MYNNFPWMSSSGSSLAASLAPLNGLAQVNNVDMGSVLNTIPQSELIQAAGSLPNLTAGGNGMFSASNLPGTINGILGGVSSIGNLLASFKALSLANKQFQFQKDFSTKNLANQVATYNTALADRARSRGVMEGQSAAQTQAYIDQNKLTGLGG